MVFDKSRVYTALNADELKVGSKVIIANTIGNLKELVEQNMAELSDLTRIDSVYSDKRFVVNEDTDRVCAFSFAYLISEPEKKKLKWTDLNIGDIIKGECTIKMVTQIDNTLETKQHVYAGASWLYDSNLEENYEKVE